jgi:hypothetical protein
MPFTAGFLIISAFGGPYWLPAAMAVIALGLVDAHWRRTEPFDVRQVVAVEGDQGPSEQWHGGGEARYDLRCEPFEQQARGPRGLGCASGIQRRARDVLQPDPAG